MTPRASPARARVARAGAGRGLAWALAALVLGGAAGASATPSTPAATTSSPAKLALSPCRLSGLEHDALCGVLRRPLDPARPEGPSIDVHVAVLPAVARQKLPDPVFFLAGGPGQSAIDLAGAIGRMVGRLGARRDIVLVDQRGTGRSAPLACDTPGPEEAVARAFDHARMVDALARCREQLARRPWGDLRQYTTTIAMQDLDAVRAALGADRIDLMGVSYGTRAALEYLRAYPGHVRRVVLDAVAPPDMVLPQAMAVDGAAALDGVFRHCEATPACARAHPGLAARWRGFLASLPRAYTAADPADGRPRRFTLTAEAAWSLVRPGLYVPAVGAAIPYAIDQAADGHLEPLLAVGSAMGGSGGLDLYEGMHFSVICAEDVPRLPPPAPGEEGTVRLYRDVCAGWPRGTVPAAFYTVPRSASPVLLLSGSADPVTPPRHAQRVAAALGPLARSLVVPNNGHGALSLGCIREEAQRFIDEPDPARALKVDGSCVAAMPAPLPFEPPLPRRASSAPGDVPATTPGAGLPSAPPRGARP